MAGDWIKMRTDLRNHPKVVRMASALKADRLRIIGGLWAVWGTFDTHSIDGLLEGYTFEAIDEDLGWRGFASAMARIDWLTQTDDGLEIPEFDEHNGASAKRRATDAKRKKNDREVDKSADGSWNESGQMSASEADKLQTRVDLEKEKEKTRTRTRSEPSERFEAFWAAFPKSPRKGGKGDCAKEWAKTNLEAESVSIIAHVAAMAQTEGWKKQGGEFIPAPLVYLRAKRWDGADMGTPTLASAWEDAE